MQIIYMLLRASLAFALLPSLLFANSFLTPNIKNHGSYKPDILFQDQLKPLLGHVPFDVNGATKVAPLNEGTKLKLSVVLPLNNETELDEFLIATISRDNVFFGLVLEQEEFIARFAPTVEQVDKLSSYLTQNGFIIESIEPNRMIIKVSGEIKDINRVFNTEIYNYQDENGEQFYAPAYELQVDQQLPILSVLGLENRVKARSYHKMMEATQAVPGFEPAEIKKAYSLSSSLNGKGQTLALFQLDGFTESDIRAYENAFGIAHVPLQVIKVDGFSGAPGGGAGEVTLDIELMIALSPGVDKILVYEGPNTSSGVINTYNKIATDNLAKSVSSSWGLSERQSQGSSMQAENQIFKQMAAQGQAMFAASGDSGAYDDGSNLGTDDPSSQPFVVGVGGTTLSVNADGSYLKETTWSSGNGPGHQGGGGGISSVWSIPTWQQGLASSNNKASTTMRNVPDISLDADPQTGYAIYFNGKWTVFGGTSCAAPLWAAFWAQVNQQRVLNSQSPLGFPNPHLYQAGASPSFSSIFHDTTVGTNGFYPAVAGFDLATGWGTFIGDKLISYLAPSGSPVCTRANPTVNITPSSQQGAPGSTLSYAVSVTNNDSSACGSSNFNLSSVVPSGFSNALAQNSLNIQPGQNGATSITVTSPANAPLGDQSFSVTAANASLPSFTGSASAVYSVQQDASLKMTITPHDAWFARGSLASWQIGLTNNRAPVAGNTINIVITGPQSASGSGQTGPSGLINVGWRPNLRGRYQISASSTYQGKLVSTQTTFTVY